MKDFQASYLKRRATRGSDTPTDMAYRKFQALEDELIFLLSQLHEAAEKG
jgi:hypothetical protein